MIISLLSSLFAAAVFGASVPLTLGTAGAIIVVVVMHEYGHYITAIILDEPAVPPRFIPIPFLGIIGFTKIPKVNLRSHRYISLAGPITGAVTAGVLIVLAYTLGIELSIGFITLVAVYELLSATLFNDGKQYRKINKMIRKEEECLR